MGYPLHSNNNLVGPHIVQYNWSQILNLLYIIVKRIFWCNFCWPGWHGTKLVQYNKETIQTTMPCTGVGMPKNEGKLKDHHHRPRASWCLSKLIDNGKVNVWTICVCVYRNTIADSFLGERIIVFFEKTRIRLSENWISQFSFFSKKSIKVTLNGLETTKYCKN